MHCQAHNTHYVRRQHLSVVVPFGMSHWRTAYSEQASRRSMNHEKTHVAGRRVARASCSQCRNGKGLPKPLNTHLAEFFLWRFSSCPRKKSEIIVEITRYKRSNASRTHCSCWYIDDLLALLWWPTRSPAPTSHLSCITQSCIRIASITALLCAMIRSGQIVQ